MIKSRVVRTTVDNLRIDDFVVHVGPSRSMVSGTLETMSQSHYSTALQTRAWDLSFSNGMQITACGDDSVTIERMYL